MTSTVYIVVVSNADGIAEIWTENDHGLLDQQAADELAQTGEQTPGNERRHHVMPVTVGRRSTDAPPVKLGNVRPLPPGTVRAVS